MGVSFYSRIPQIAANMGPRAGAIVQKTAADIEAQAKTLAPVDTGALQNSITWRPTGQTSAEVFTGIDYSIYQEYGTYKMSAQPFMVPAAWHAMPQFYAAMSGIVS